jgi:hypothetical protein
MWDKEFVLIDELSLVRSQMAWSMSDDDAMSVIISISDDDLPEIESRSPGGPVTATSTQGPRMIRTCFRIVRI